MTATSAATRARIERTALHARALLLAQRAPGGHWVGELSSSALSTATATAALALAARSSADEKEALLSLVRAGQAWLAANVNDDGGFGDTQDSPSNLSTTALAWMALGLEAEGRQEESVVRARTAVTEHLERALGSLDAPTLAKALERVYGEDRTFAVPILVACAIGGAFEHDADLWAAVPGLPFELALLPQRLFRWAGMPVVSYALPALIAIGQAIEHHRPARSAPLRALRRAARGRTLRVLESIQPENGGFLEATPLTSFVVLAMHAIGQGRHRVARRGVEFLTSSVRHDGSRAAWPIDTNLATWVTTLSVHALAGSGGGDGLTEDMGPTGRGAVRNWLLAQQHRVRHPYTGASPGGWAWTDLPGGVPDADDTAGALIALRALADGVDTSAASAALSGVRWLVELQNRDGGVPTFCRGFGTLPFDQSSADLTAHALRAWWAWRGQLEGRAADRVARACERATRFLVRTQREDGAWIPLWFGNQAAPAQENPLYGTSRVLRAAPVPVAGHDLALEWRSACDRALGWLLAAQTREGGFGGAAGVRASVEETALGLEALCDAAAAGLGAESGDLQLAIARAACWLAQATDEGQRFEARPIGLYFAKLWYSERLYPLVFAVSALERARSVLAP